MTVHAKLDKLFSKFDKVVCGFDDEKERKNPGEMEVSSAVKASNGQLPTIDHRTDEHSYQVPAPGSEHQAPAHKQSREHPLPDPANTS